MTTDAAPGTNRRDRLMGLLRCNGSLGYKTSASVNLDVEWLGDIEAAVHIDGCGRGAARVGVLSDIDFAAHFLAEGALLDEDPIDIADDVGSREAPVHGYGRLRLLWFGRIGHLSAAAGEGNAGQRE